MLTSRDRTVKKVLTASFTGTVGDLAEETAVTSDVRISDAPSDTTNVWKDL